MIRSNSQTLNLNFKKFNPLEAKSEQDDDPDQIPGKLWVKIEDSGCGISEENISKLFNKFSQVNDDPNKRKIGTGLGLWLCKKLCEKMGG